MGLKPASKTQLATAQY